MRTGSRLVLPVLGQMPGCDRLLVRIAQVSKLTVTLVPLRDEEDQEEDCITDVLEEKMLEALQAETPNSVRAQWQLAKWTYEEPRSVANMVSSEELAATRLMYYIDDEGERVYTIKVLNPSTPSPDDPNAHSVAFARAE